MILALAAGLAGCVVTALQPFYTEADLSFDPGLIGRWVAGQDAPDGTPPKEVLEFKRDGDNGYLAALTGDDGKVQTFVARRFKLGEQIFLDLFPVGEHGAEFVPVHQVQRLSGPGPTLKMTGLKYEWVQKLLEAQPDALRHVVVAHRLEDGKEPARIVLTASTKELQAFLNKHVKTAEAWDDWTEFRRLSPAPDTKAAAPKQ